MNIANKKCNDALQQDVIMKLIKESVNLSTNTCLANVTANYIVVQKDCYYCFYKKKQLLHIWTSFNTLFSFACIGR